MRYLTNDYLNLKRWDSYYKQLELIQSVKAKSVLEIGPGNGVLSSVLRRFGIHIKTFDIDPEVPANWHGDVKDISSIVPLERFDCVVAFEVLEHVPWKNVQRILCGIKKVTKRWIIISVPYSGIFMMPVLRLGRRGLREWKIGVRIPGFWRSDKYYKRSGHYWECGAAGYNIRRVRKMFASLLNIVAEDYHPVDKSQVFWILEKGLR